MTEETKGNTGINEENSIDKNSANNQVDIKRLANLCSLVVQEGSESTLKKELLEIFDYFESLNQYDTQNIIPMSHVHQDHNVLRQDIVQTSLTREEALSLAPERKGAFFKVPLIID